MSSLRHINATNQRLAGKIYQRVLTAIQAGTIGPTERIVQEKLAEKLRVSRTPVREALFRLEQEGVLVIAGRGGFRIRHVSDRDVREIYQARKAIEGYGARTLAEAPDEPRIERLKAVIVKQESQTFASVADYYDANRTIHRAFIAETGNRYLLEMFDSMWNRSLSFHIFSSMSDTTLRQSLTGHMALLEAIRFGPPDRAAEAMFHHIDGGLSMQLAALEGARKAGRIA